MDTDKDMKEKPYYEIVFVVLVYKNVEVLQHFFASLSLPYSYHVIVVNSFYDEKTEKECRLISEENHADFISMTNKGFGAGNNAGSKFAMERYQFRFLILSNSDVKVQNLDALHLTDHERAVYAADIRMENGHRQNPHLPFRNRFYLKLLDLSYHFKSEALMTVAFAFNRILRELVFVWTKLNGGRMVRIFSAHGSFIALTYQASLELSPIFHEDMFLYNEELYLAHRCRLFNIPVYYVPKMKVIHLEGASSTKQSNAWKNHEDSYRVLSSWLRDNKFL